MSQGFIPWSAKRRVLFEAGLVFLITVGVFMGGFWVLDRIAPVPGPSPTGMRRIWASEAKAALEGIYSGQKAFYAEWGQYGVDFRDIGYQPDGRIRFIVLMVPSNSSRMADPVGLSGLSGPPRGKCNGTDSPPECGFDVFKQKEFFAAAPFKPYALHLAAKSADSNGFTSVAFSCLHEFCTENELDIWTINENKELKHVQDGIQPTIGESIVGILQVIGLLSLMSAAAPVAWYRRRLRRLRRQSEQAHVQESRVAS